VWDQIPLTPDDFRTSAWAIILYYIIYKYIYIYEWYVTRIPQSESKSIRALTEVSFGCPPPSPPPSLHNGTLHPYHFDVSTTLIYTTLKILHTSPHLQWQQRHAPPWPPWPGEQHAECHPTRLRCRSSPCVRPLNFCLFCDSWASLTFS